MRTVQHEQSISKMLLVKKGFLAIACGHGLDLPW